MVADDGQVSQVLQFADTALDDLSIEPQLRIEGCVVDRDRFQLHVAELLHSVDQSALLVKKLYEVTFWLIENFSLIGLNFEQFVRSRQYFQLGFL